MTNAFGSSWLARAVQKLEHIMCGARNLLTRLTGSRFAIILVSAFVCCGCGAGRGDIMGKVTQKQRPVVFGTVLVVGGDGLPHFGPIQEDGSYTVEDVPAGPVRIAVNSPDPTTPLFNRDDEKKGRPRPQKTRSGWRH